MRCFSSTVPFLGLEWAANKRDAKNREEGEGDEHKRGGKEQGSEEPAARGGQAARGNYLLWRKMRWTLLLEPHCGRRNEEGRGENGVKTGGG